MDIAFALINTFQESHEMTGSNLLNMYIAEEYREFLPEVILTAVFSLIIQAEKPFIEMPVFYTILVNSLIEQSKSIESLKKLRAQITALFEAKSEDGKYKIFARLKAKKEVIE